jgi:hypothetical protein
MRLRKLGHGQSVTFIVPEEIASKIRELTAKTIDNLITVEDVICWSISETWQDLKRSMPLWAVQERFETHKHLLKGANTTEDEARAILEDEAQNLEVRYKPRIEGDDETLQAFGWKLSNAAIALIVGRCRDFEAMHFGSATLDEEQERELAAEMEEERQVERPPKMEAETHNLHPDLVRLAHLGYIQEKSTTFQSAFKASRSTSSAKLRLGRKALFSYRFARYGRLHAHRQDTLKLITCYIHYGFVPATGSIRSDLCKPEMRGVRPSGYPYLTL